MIAFLSQARRNYAWTRRTERAAYAPRDGARGLIIGTRLYMLGGWDPTNPAFTAGGWTAGTTNEVWYSDDDGLTWVNVLGQDPATTTRWKPRHEFGCVHIGGYVYVVGGDSNTAAYQKDVWRAADTDLSTWTRMTADWGGPGNRVLYQCYARGNAIFVAGGQTIKSLTGEDPETHYADVWRSTDGGATFSQVATGTQLSHQCAGGVAEFNGAVFVVAGGRYKAEFTRKVSSTVDGIAFTDRAEPGFDQRYYNDAAPYDGRLWTYGGYADTSQYGEPGGSDISGLGGFNRGDCWYTSDGDHWVRFAPTEVVGTTPPLTHASTVYGKGTGLIIGAGNHLTRAVWQLYRVNATAVPEVGEVTPGSGDSTTAVPLVIYGKHFTGATQVVVGSTTFNSGTFVIVSDAEITLTYGAIAGGPTGAVTIAVTRPSGTGIRISAYEMTGAPFDVATLPLSLYLRDYATAGTWNGTASAGTSGDANNRVTTPGGGAPSPTLGAAVNGHVPAVFNPANLQQMQGLNFYIIGNGANTAGSIAALVKVTSVSAGSSDAWLSPLMIGDASGAVYGIAVGSPTNDKVQAFWDAFNTPLLKVETAVTIGSYALYQQRWNNSIIEYRLNGGSWTSLPYRTPDVYGLFSLGKSAGSHYLGMEMLAAFAAKVRLSDADFDGILSWSRGFSGLALT